MILLKEYFRKIMTLLVYYNIELYQVDIKIFFLSGGNDKLIYGETQLTLCPKM